MRTMPDADIMARYRFIIVDEAHERSHDIDALLMRLKIFLKRNLGDPRLPFVLLASATLPVAKYAAYFGVGGDNVIEVRGRAFEVETRWPRVGTNNFLGEAARVAAEIHEQNLDDAPTEADILIFLPGKSEIKRVSDALTKTNSRYRAPGSRIPPFLLLEIYGEVVIGEGRDYRLLKEPPSALPSLPSQDGATFLRPFRRIIVSTVVAETGLTIGTLKYVIDCGWSRVEEIYFPGRYRGLITRPAPRSRIEQRKGRAGRKFPGVFYPLYTRNVYEALPVEQLPDIVVGGIGPIVLDIVETTAEAAALARRVPGRPAPAPVFRVEDIDMLDPPRSTPWRRPWKSASPWPPLRSAADGAPAGHTMTRLGETAGRLPSWGSTRPRPPGGLPLEGLAPRPGADRRSLTSATRSSTPSRPRPEPGRGQREGRQKALRAGLPAHLVGTRDDVLRARLLISDDFVETLLAFEGFARALDGSGGDLPRLLDWCEENGVSFEGATLLASLRDAVMDEMLAAGLNPFWGEAFRLASAPPEAFLDVVSRLKYCIFAGLRFSLLTFDAETRAYRGRGGDRVEVPPVRTDEALDRLRALGVGEAALAELAQPRRVVSNTVRLRGAKGDQRDRAPPFLYRLQPGMVSVLDGYVEIDTAERDPRQIAAANRRR